MARGVRTKQLSRKRLAKTALSSKSCVVHSHGIVGKTGKVRGCGLEGRSQKFQSSANSPIQEQSRCNSVASGLRRQLFPWDYFRMARNPSRTDAQRGDHFLQAVTESLRPGSMRYCISRTLSAPRKPRQSAPTQGKSVTFGVTRGCIAVASPVSSITWLIAP